MKKLLIVSGLSLVLNASAQYWTTNTTITQVTNLVPQITTNEVGEVWQQVEVIRSVTNIVVTPIIVTNNVKCVLTAEAEANLRELFATLKDDGQATGTFNAWFDATANQAVSAALTSKSAELSQVKQERIIRLWSKASVAQQTNALSILK